MTPAERVSERKDILLAAVCHDLRGQLNTIMGWIQAAQKSIGGVTPEKALVRIEEQIRNQAKLISDILDLSKSSIGEFQINRVAVDLNEVVWNTLTAISPLSATKNIAVAFHPGEPPTIVIGDGLQLQRVISNLLTNAIRFTPEKGQVDVAIESSGNSIQLSVSDNGRGFSPEFQRRIFDRFEQEEKHRSQAQGGIGLGLPIVRRLVELHRGTVKAESEGRGKGAKFTITLPRPNALQSLGIQVN